MTNILILKFMGLGPLLLLSCRRRPASTVPVIERLKRGSRPAPGRLKRSAAFVGTSAPESCSRFVLLSAAQPANPWRQAMAGSKPGHRDEDMIVTDRSWA